MTYIAEQDPNSPIYTAALVASERDADPREFHPESLTLVSEDDVILVTQQDRDDLQWVLDWEEYHL